MPIGIVVERREIDHPWQSYTWRAVAAIPGAPEVNEWRVLTTEPGRIRYHAGTLPLEIHHKETEGYRLNLATARPALYVVLRYDEEVETGIVPFMVTACPYEAQNYLDGDEDLVESMPMPDAVAAWHPSPGGKVAHRGRVCGGRTRARNAVRRLGFGVRSEERSKFANAPSLHPTASHIA